MKRQTERDKQSKIGASQFGSPCSRCVAEALIPHWHKLQGIEADVMEEGNKYWLGAHNGTAIHDYIEGRVNEYEPGWITETKVTIGELEDYGKIGSRLDLYIPELKHVVDWKTSTRDKVKMYKIAEVTEAEPYDTNEMARARFTLQQYTGQIMSYAWGLEQQGYEVNNVSLVFICRDGKTDEDIWSYDLAYDKEYAQRVWTRLEAIWEAVKGGREINTFTAHPDCFCQVTFV